MSKVGDSVPKRVVIGAQAKQQLIADAWAAPPNCTVEAIASGKAGLYLSTLTGDAKRWN